MVDCYVLYKNSNDPSKSQGSELCMYVCIYVPRMCHSLLKSNQSPAFTNVSNFKLCLRIFASFSLFPFFHPQFEPPPLLNSIPIFQVHRDLTFRNSNIFTITFIFFIKKLKLRQTKSNTYSEIITFKTISSETTIQNKYLG